MSRSAVAISVLLLASVLPMTLAMRKTVELVDMPYCGADICARLGSRGPFIVQGAYCTCQGRAPPKPATQDSRFSFYTEGAKVEVLRSSGRWSPGIVDKVDRVTGAVTVALDDGRAKVFPASTFLTHLRIQQPVVAQAGPVGVLDHQASSGSMSTVFIENKAAMSYTQVIEDFVGCDRLGKAGGQNDGLWLCTGKGAEPQIAGLLPGPYLLKAGRASYGQTKKITLDALQGVEAHGAWAEKHMPGWPLALYKTREGFLSVMRSAKGKPTNEIYGQLSTEAFQAIAGALREFCSNMCGGRPSLGAACHKDTNPGNIFWDEATKTVGFIDLDGVNALMQPSVRQKNCAGSDIEVFLGWASVFGKSLGPALEKQLVRDGSCPGVPRSPCER